MSKRLLTFQLDPEHMAMLDAISAPRRRASRNQTAKNLLIAVLEDDAVAQGAGPRADDEKVIVLRRRRDLERQA